MNHDHGYKLLFSHAEMVADLLRGFVREDWVEALDFSTLEKMGGSYIADDLRDREDDVIWRVRWGQEWLYIYLLIEFQSKVERFMAVRILSYLGLLYQDLIRMKQWTADRRLPPVLPIVLYNGNKRWDAPEEIGELIVPVPGGLERYRPNLRYFLLDEGRFADSELASLQNLVAALFRMENSRTRQDVDSAIGALADWLQAPEQESLRRAFVVWLKRVHLKGRVSDKELINLNNLQEVKSMLAERWVEWEEQWKREGIQEGRQEGRQEGKQEGESTLLLRQMTLRFGLLEETLRERIRTADAETLLQWGERILTAATAEEVVKE